MSTAVTDIKQRIEAANAEAVGRMISAEPVLVDIAPAGDVVPGLEDRMILHSGPPIAWERMSGAQRGSCIGIVRYEGWASSPSDAEALLASGRIRLEPNHHHRSVGPMAGTISPSLPVFVVEDRTTGQRGHCRVVEPRQQFGDFSDEAIGGLFSWAHVFAPSIREGLRRLGELPLKPLIAKALQMGDELHNRQVAASSLFANALAAPMLEAGVPADRLAPTLRYLAGHEVFFLGLSMAAGKSISLAATDVAYSTVVTTMARNGTEFGIRVAGLGDEWFTAAAPPIEGLMMPGRRPEEAGLDIGDSAITETVGWGAFVLGGAPGILSLVGGTPEGALRISRDMKEITVATHPVYRIPALGFEGAPIGIDIRKVVRTGIVPIIDTAIAHREPGHGLIGAGLVRAPMECFRKALVAFAARHGSS
ncbi:MAG TPA: DUF1116 domain-containing protein [Candidatus Limnocylindria bacterium]|jgi:hypothetical protein|nr:DUF1116 domain-containing protein [Candidatus Limnocylindria bacterium]